MESNNTATPPPRPVVSRVPFACTGAALALCLIVFCVVFVLNRNASAKAATEKSASVVQSPVFDMMARYMYGFRMLMLQSGQWNPKLAGPMEESMRVTLKKPEDRFRIEILRGVMNDRPSSEAELQNVVGESPQLERDLAVLRDLEQNGRAVPEEDWKWFSNRHGWTARLARAQSLPRQDAEWKKLASDGEQVVAVLGASATVMFLSFVAGLALFVIAFLRWRKGELPVCLDRPSGQWGGGLIEGFAIYISGWTLLPTVLARRFPEMPHWSYYITGGLCVVLAMFWPRLRGVKVTEWKGTLGLHTGQGTGREMLAGVLGWLAMLPLLVACMFAAQFIARYTNADMQHPIMQEFATPGWRQFGAVMLATVWAPVVEELMFRGLLFPGLSSYARWAVGAFAGAFIFAVVHPQGWAAVPAIMTIALMASTLRLVRGSVIAPMTAHALNNGLITVLMVMVSR